MGGLRFLSELDKVGGGQQRSRAEVGVKPGQTIQTDDNQVIVKVQRLGVNILVVVSV